MKSFFLSASILAVGASGALAGGLDRSGQGVGIIFEEGGYVQLSFGAVSPTVTGTLGPFASGDMAASYLQFGLAVKQDISDKISVAVVFDQPYGASVSYPAGAYPLAGTTAEVTSQALTAVGRYKLSDRMSVYAGLRTQNIAGDIAITGGYFLNVEAAGDLGYLVGAAYEIPDIALRVAVTYNSPIATTLTGTEVVVGDVSLDVTMPQSVNIDFQSGIAADTLLFGSIRWVEWTAFDLMPPAYALANGGDSLLDYDNDVFTYTLGVGRKLSDTFSASVALGYEAATATPATPSSNLSPTDGYFSVQLGGVYRKNNMKITGGVRYLMLGDATTATLGTTFADNTALAGGVQIGYSF